MNPDTNSGLALTSIKERFGPESCNILTTIFKKGEEANTVTIKEGVVRITKIEVVGVFDGQKLMHLNAPMTQYAPIF